MSLAEGRNYGKLIKAIHENRKISKLKIESANEINQKLPGLNYILLKNCVYDINHLHHPGGQFIL